MSKMTLRAEQANRLASAGAKFTKNGTCHAK